MLTAAKLFVFVFLVAGLLSYIVGCSNIIESVPSSIQLSYILFDGWISNPIEIFKKKVVSIDLLGV